MYSSLTEFRMQLRRAVLALQYLVYCRCCLLNTCMVSCARKGSVFSAVAVGSVARADAEARIVMWAGGWGQSRELRVR